MLHTKIWRLVSELVYIYEIYNVWTHVSHENIMSRVRTYGHRELITFPIDSNGDPPGLWQFIVHLTMNVGYYNMP